MSTVAAAVAKYEVNSLALLGLKVAPNVFDLSSSLTHVSIRDQIIRGQLLIRDLRAVDDKFRSILIVGAGVAGLAAAAEAASAGVAVNVVDVASRPLSLLRNVTSRFVGPFMYEWPGPTYANQDFPPAPGLLWPTHRPSTPTWSSSSPMTAKSFAQAFESWLIGYRVNFPNLKVWMDAPRSEIESFVKSFVVNSRAKCAPSIMKLRPPASALMGLSAATAWPDPLGAQWAPIRPDYVILAAGMGSEDTTLCNSSSVKGLPFWTNDRLKDAAVSCERVGIFGGGDGALQDVLRILTNCDHPIEFLEKICAGPYVASEIEKQERHLRAAEDQSRLYGTWTEGAASHTQVDRVCVDIAKQLAADSRVRDAVRRELRTCSQNGGAGQLHHFVRGGNFSKAYLLNRFLVHLLRHCYMKEANSPAWSTCMQYHVHWHAEATNGRLLPTGETEVDIHQTGTLSITPPYLFDHVVVRYGMEEKSMPAMQMVRLSNNESGQRTTLAHVHLPHLLYD